MTVISEQVARTESGSKIGRKVEGRLISKYPSGKEITIGTRPSHDVYSEDYKCELSIEDDKGCLEKVVFGTTVGFELVGKRVLYLQTEIINAGSTSGIRQERQELFLPDEGNQLAYYCIRNSTCSVQS